MNLQMCKTETLEKVNPYFLFIPLYIVLGLAGLSSWSVYNINLAPEILYALFLICMIFNIFVYKTYNLKKFIIHILLTILFWVIGTNAHRFTMLTLWLYLISIPPICFKKISKVVLIFTCISLISLVTLTALGYGQNIVFERVGWLDRYSYGFINPNIFSAYLFQICLAITYLRWKDFGTKDNLFFFSVFCLVTFFTNSRTTAVLIILLMLMVNISRLLQKNALKTNYIFANLMLILCPAVTFLLVNLYKSGIPFAVYIDGLLSHRFRNICYCMATQPIKWFGDIIQIKYSMHFLTTTYGILLIRNGLISFLIFLFCYAIVIRKIYEKKDIPLLIILSLGLIQSITEQYFLMPYVNFAIISFSVLLNNKNITKCKTNEI